MKFTCDGRHDVLIILKYRENHNLFVCTHWLPIFCSQYRLYVPKYDHFHSLRFPNALFNDAVNCKPYIASVAEEWMSRKQWWNDIDKENWSTQKKACPSVTMSTKNPTWTIPCYTNTNTVYLKVLLCNLLSTKIPQVQYAYKYTQEITCLLVITQFTGAINYHITL